VRTGRGGVLAGPLVRDQSVTRLAPPADRDATGHRPYPRLGVPVPLHPGPALPRPGVRLLDGVLRLGGIPAHGVDGLEQPQPAAPVELVEGVRVGHRPASAGAAARTASSRLDARPVTTSSPRRTTAANHSRAGRGGANLVVLTSNDSSPANPSSTTAFCSRNAAGSARPPDS